MGCTSEPHEGSKKEFKKFFNKSIYFPFPDYTTRRLMWKTFIEEHGGKIKADFPLSTLAHISDGYSAGSIKKTCQYVLTQFRKTKVSLICVDYTSPLNPQEIVTVLEIPNHFCLALLIMYSWSRDL